MSLDRSTAHFFTRALTIGIVVGFLISAVMVWRHRVALTAPPFPIELPAAVAWASRSKTKLPDGTVRRLTEAFVAKGSMFRLEVARPHQPAIVWIYDGKDLAVNARVPARGVEAIDPRNTLVAAYAGFPAYRYLGTEKVGDYACWVFVQGTAEVQSAFWIDRKAKVPRRIRLTYADGRVDEQIFVDLPEYRINRDGLFDPRNLGAALIDSAEAMTGS